MLVALWEVSPKIDLNLVLRREITVTGKLNLFTICRHS